MQKRQLPTSRRTGAKGPAKGAFDRVLALECSNALEALSGKPQELLSPGNLYVHIVDYEAYIARAQTIRVSFSSGMLTVKYSRPEWEKACGGDLEEDEEHALVSVPGHDARVPVGRKQARRHFHAHLRRTTRWRRVLVQSRASVAEKESSPTRRP